MKRPSNRAISLTLFVIFIAVVISTLLILNSLLSSALARAGFEDVKITFGLPRLDTIFISKLSVRKPGHWKLRVEDASVSFNIRQRSLNTIAIDAITVDMEESAARAEQVSPDAAAFLIPTPRSILEKISFEKLSVETALLRFPNEHIANSFTANSVSLLSSNDSLAIAAGLNHQDRPLISIHGSVNQTEGIRLALATAGESEKKILEIIVAQSAEPELFAFSSTISLNQRLLESSSGVFPRANQTLKQGTADAEFVFSGTMPKTVSSAQQFLQAVSGIGGFQISGKKLLLADVAGTYDIDAKGVIALDAGRLITQFTKKGLLAVTDLAQQKLSLKRAEISVPSGTKIDSNLQTLKMRDIALAISAEGMNLGLPIHSLQGFVSIENISPNNPPRVIAKNVVTQFCGAGIKADQAQIYPLQKKQAVLIEIRGLDLDCLLKLHPQEFLSGSGVLDASVPLTIDGKLFSVKNGSFQAQQPGGTLRYKRDPAQKQGGHLELTLSLLENFNYTLLGGDISYAPDGTLILKTKLSGSNPQQQGGRAVEFNVSFEENIPALVKSLSTGSNLSKRFENAAGKHLQKAH